LSPKEAETVLKDLQETPAYAVYADGMRLQLGSARIYTFERERASWVQWGGVRIRRRGTIDRIEFGSISIAIAPEDVHVDMTFSASAPLAEVLGPQATT
jgi:hypothetical protein